MQYQSEGSFDPKECSDKLLGFNPIKCYKVLGVYSHLGL